MNVSNWELGKLGDAYYFPQKDRSTCPRGCEFAVDVFEMGEIAGCCQQSILGNMKSKRSFIKTLGVQFLC